MKNIKKCKTCGQNRKYVPIILVNNAVSFICFETDKCTECGRLPANHPAVIQALNVIKLKKNKRS